MDSFAFLLSVGVLDLRSSSLKVTRWALGGITGSKKHFQRDNLSPNTLSFHFPSEFREKGLPRSQVSESPCRGHVNNPKYFWSRHAITRLDLGSTFVSPDNNCLREAYG
jgi:hypothetical protein